MVGRYSRPNYPEIFSNPPFEPSSPRPSDSAIPLSHTRATIHPNPSPPPGFETAGMGRLVTFSFPQPLTSLIDRIGKSLGSPRGFAVAIPQTQQVDNIHIRTVGICPGSGSSILLQNGVPAADVLLTGELSHHDALAAIERGSAVITLFHSNSERGYLHDVMRSKLETTLEAEWAATAEELGRDQDAGSQDWNKAALGDRDVRVDVSERDRDPYGIVVLQK
jgi:putative NIF3 family GTP cyclohydrolase 1 type 2